VRGDRIVKREKPDGIDVAIVAFLGARLNGESIEQATRNAEAMLDLFGIPRDHHTHPKEG
jgi:hypothetical protein